MHVCILTEKRERGPENCIDSHFDLWAFLCDSTGRVVERRREEEEKEEERERLLLSDLFTYIGNS